MQPESHHSTSILFQLLYLWLDFFFSAPKIFCQKISRKCKVHFLLKYKGHFDSYLGFIAFLNITPV